MADDVAIKFGADVGAALAAIDQLKQGLSGLSEPIARIKSAFAATTAPFAAAEREKIQEAKGDWAQITAIYQQWLDRTKAIYGEASTEYKRVQRDMVAAQQQQAAETYRLAEEDAAARQRADASYLETFRRNAQVLVDQRKITDQQALGYDIAYSSELYAQERSRLEAILANDATLAAEKQKIYEELMQLDARYAAQVAETQKQMADQARTQAERLQRSYEQAFDQLGSSAMRTFNQILEGQTTWQKGARKLVQDFENFFLDGVEQMAAKWAASGLASLAGGAVSTAVTGAQATGGSGLGAGLMALVGVGQPGGVLGSGLFSASSAASGAALDTMTASASAAGIMLDTLTTSAATASAALGAAGAAGAVGTAGSGVLGTVGGALLAFAGGGIVPSAAGGWALPSFAGATPALLHSREMVLPADLSQGLQGMIRGGGASGGDTHVHVHAIDGRSGARFLMAHAHDIARALSRAQRGFSPATMSR